MRLKLVSTLTLTLSFAAIVFLAAVAWNSALAASSDIQSKQATQLTTQSSQTAIQKTAIGQIVSDDFAAALQSVASLRLYYVEHLGAYGQSPESINDLGLSEHDFQNEFVEHVGISSASGAILIGLDDQFGDKHWAALIPTIEQYQVTGWRCQTTLSQTNVGDVDCKPNVAYSQVDHVFDPSVLLSSITGIHSLRIGYSEFYQGNGSVPESIDDFQVEPDHLKAKHLSHVMVDPNSMTMLIGLDDAMYGINQWVAATPILYNNYYIIGWTCRTTLSNQVVSAAGATGCTADQSLDELL